MRLRFILGVGIAVIAAAIAAYVHQRHAWRYCFDFGGGRYRCRYHPSWEDPVALLIVVGGVAVAAGVIAAHRRASRPAS